jgi:Spy/CpxP family protein refolding chaperone
LTTALAVLSAWLVVPARAADSAPSDAPSGISDARPARPARPGRPNQSQSLSPDGAPPRAGNPPGGGLQDIGRILTPEQREVFRATMQEQRPQMQALEEMLSRIHQELDETMLAETLDESSVRAKVRQLSEVEGDRLLLRARAIAKIRPTLSPDQLEQLRNSMSQTRRLRRPGAGLPGDRFGNPNGNGNGNGNDNGPGNRRPRRPGEPEREGADLPPPRPASPGPASP